MALISVGVDHQHASLDLLERVTVPEHEWSKMLRTLVSHRNIHEAVFLSTCLRTEVVAVIDRFHGAIEEITQTLCEATGVDPTELDDRLTVHFEHDVATHLFRIAAGLESVVPGEFEILGQLRRALDLAIEEQTTGAEIVELFQRSISSGRRVRNETGIARGTTSFAQAAVTVAVEELGDELKDSAVVVVGAGQLAAGVSKSLVEHEPRVGRITILNRTTAGANELAASLDDSRVDVGELTELSKVLGGARLAVVAVEVATPLVSVSDVVTRSSPILIVDLGMPRAVAREVDDVASVRRVDIEDLRDRVDRALGDRREAISAAEAIVVGDVERFLLDQRARGAAAIVRDLRDHFDEVVSNELSRRERELEALLPEERERVISLIRSVVAKIAHRPTVTLKEAAGTDQGSRLSEATRQLFDL